MGKIDVNKKIKETALLNTAFEIFTAKGFTKTSIADIVDKAGVAKGTFYLYFKDKYDIRNKLVSRKSSQLFRNAVTDLQRNNERLSFEDKIIAIVDNIIDQLNLDKSLLTFISKNLSWGIFKNALNEPSDDENINFFDVYRSMLDEAPYDFSDPEIMLFLIVEFVSSTCHSVILYSEPCSIETLKPHLYAAIRRIISNHKMLNRL